MRVVEKLEPKPRPRPFSQVFLETALSQVGEPYSWGAAGPGAFDCSGLVMWTYYQVTGIQIPHNDEAQWEFWVTHPELCACSMRERMPEPGDLIFKAHGGHEMIYVDETTYLHASGDSVKLSPFDWNNSSRFARFVRLCYPPGMEPIMEER